MQQLLGYTLQHKIHDGAKKVLWRGVRDKDGAPVVIKLLKGEHPDPRELAQLRHEFTIAREIDWPGVARTYALEPWGHSLALVLEDVRSASLSRYMQHHTLDLGATLRIARSLAAILEGIHAHGVIHKDIKPQNILLNERTLDVHIIDFSIASRLPQESQAPGHPDRLGSFEGTLAYLSPEQTGRMNRTIDHRTDFYSLGVTLYQMLTGVLPFDTTDPMELVHSHIARTPVPPHVRRPDVPEAVSALVMKLLEKTAENRYQHAPGLLADLDECLRQWEESGTVTPFPPGEHDLSEALKLPQKLYGRDIEQEALLNAFERITDKRSELLLITGAPGIGKSALVHEMHKPLARRAGKLITGKFEKLHRGTPLTGFTQAFRGLVRHVLGEPAAKLAAWKEALLLALGSNGQLLIELIPELEIVLGPQPPVVEVGPTESQNRLSLAMQRFVRVFCDSLSPLVLFLDDLQWADAASLWLLRLLLTDPEGGHLLILGAYRDSEVDEVHPLRSALHELRNQGVVPEVLSLGPLDPPSVQRLLEDTFTKSEPSRIEALTALAIAKTQGNPFFLSQFLLELHRRKLIRLDRSAGRWTWDESEIAAAPVTENVVELMAARIELLDEDTQRLLSLAACIGHQFDLATLALIADLPRLRAGTTLWPALQSRLLVPVGTDYRSIPATEDEANLVPASTATLNATYRFLHDRVQQAAYSRILPADRGEVHLRIGRRLRDALTDDARTEGVFEALRHLNAGAARITEREEQIALARLNLTAGRMAKGAAAYAAAAVFFAAGIEALGKDSFQDLYDLAFDLHRGRAECESMAGHFEEAEAQMSVLLANAREDWERAEIYCLCATLYTAQGRFAEAVAAGRKGLAPFGIDLPRTPEGAQAAFIEVLAVVDRRLSEQSIESLIDAPTLTDPSQRAIVRLLCELLVPVYCVEPQLYTFVMTKAVDLLLTHGNFNQSAMVYICFGFCLAGVLGRPADGMRFGKLALKIVDKFQAAEFAHVVDYTFAYYLSFGLPMQQAVPYFRRVQQTGFEHGDLLRGPGSFSECAAILFRMGEPLERLRVEVKRGLIAARRGSASISGNLLLVIRQGIACLQGLTRSPTSFSDDAFDEEAWLAEMDQAGLALYRHYHCLCKMQVLFLHDDPEGALALLEGAEQTSMAAIGQHWTTELPLHGALVLAALYKAAPSEEKPRIRERIDGYAARLDGYAQASPENALHHKELVAAEIARIEGRPSDALDHYERAIALARRNGFPHHEALANELCASLYFSRDQGRVARVYLLEAYHGYVHWGAAAKMKLLKAKYPGVLSDASTPDDLDLFEPSVVSTQSTTTVKLLDVTAALRAAQAISSEILLDKVIHRVMRIVLANAGAERGFLILSADGELRVEAFLQVNPDTVEVGLASPLESRTDLAQTVVQLVARTSESVLLNDARNDPRWSGDSYIQRAQPKSLLCIPVTHRGRLRGVLYLENNVARDAFTGGQIDLLQMLCVQAAIAVENALLYSRVRDVSEELRGANQRLESQVAERTEDLSAANERLQQELVLREETERSRVALQEEIIRMQSNLLEELSTPLIPINKQVMVLPLIGTVDARRAERMQQAVLREVQRRGARAVLIDITGVKQVDIHVAEALVRLANAARLLGSEVILTGMRPEVAAVVVGLDADLSRLVTMGTLESGIAYAMAVGAERRRR